MKKQSFFLIVVLTISIISCKEKLKEESAVTSENNPVLSEWIYLFDGNDISGWRGFNQETLPGNWIIEDGALKSMGSGGDISGDIVYGKQSFENFELSLEWKISEGGNSGIFYHIQEGEQYTSPYQNAPEYQLIDDLGFPEPLEDWQKLGADYAMYPADPDQKIVKDAGAWNTSRIIFTPEITEYWLNGKKIVSFVPWSENWNERKGSGKWKDYPDYGNFKKGLIGLQDHGSFIWFRNIKLKEL